MNPEIQFVRTFHFFKLLESLDPAMKKSILLQLNLALENSPRRDLKLHFIQTTQNARMLSELEITLF